MDFPTFALTLVLAVILFLFFAGAIGLGLLFGKKRDKCACMAAKRVMRIHEARQKAEKNAQKYDPRLIDPESLPVVSSEINLKK